MCVGTCPVAHYRHEHDLQEEGVWSGKRWTADSLTHYIALVLEEG